MAKQVNSSFREEIKRYYELVAYETVSEKIRNQVISVANKVADDIISSYDIKKLVIKELPPTVIGKKIVVALQFEKTKK